MTETILMLVMMFAIFYFMLIRPENKRKKEAEDMRNSLKKGDVITTIGGIVGTVVKVNASTIIFETSEDRVRLEVTKWAISSTGVQTNEQAENKSEKKKKPVASDEDLDFAAPTVSTQPAIESTDVVVEEKK